MQLALREVESNVAWRIGRFLLIREVEYKRDI
jgi:hypothetical protein